MKMHVKKGDVVQVISGKGAAERLVGKVLTVDASKGRVVVEGANKVKKHKKPKTAKAQSGIIEKEGSIASSNVMLYCDKCKLPVRAGKEIRSDGSKVRVCKKCGNEFDK